MVGLVVMGLACHDAGGDAATGLMPDGAATDVLTDRSMESEDCVAIDSGGEAASGDGGNVAGGQQCGGDGTAFVVSSHGTFEVHAVFVVAYTCSSSGFAVQLADDSTPRRSVEFYLPLSPSDPTGLVGTRSISGLVMFGDVSVGGPGTLEITSASNPYVPRVAFPAGHIEGRFSFQAEGCTFAAGTFSTPYCEQACVQI